MSVVLSPALATEALWSRRDSGVIRDELVTRHLSLARRLAARYRNVNDPFDDLVQVANLGLVKAVDRYDPAQGTPFAAYATPTILGELRRYFRDTSWSLHVPRGDKELALEVQKAAERLADGAGRSPTILELAAFLGRPTEDVLRGLETAQAHFAMSLDAPVVGGGDGGPAEETTLADHAGDLDDGYGLVEMRASLRRGMARLPFAEREALALRLSENLTQSEVARRLGCSQMQVSRLLRRAAQRLREDMEL
jgi:RNA polymerase sigma-B factor